MELPAPAKRKIDSTSWKYLVTHFSKRFSREREREKIVALLFFNARTSACVYYTSSASGKERERESCPVGDAFDIFFHSISKEKYHKRNKASGVLYIYIFPSALHFSIFTSILYTYILYFTRARQTSI